MQNKIKKMAAAATAAALALPAVTFAQSTTTSNDISGYRIPNSDTAGISNQTIPVILSNVMLWLLGIVGVLGVIGFAISGVLYLTAAGDEDRIATAKKVMTYSIIGVVVALIGLVVIMTINTIFQLDASVM